MSDSLPAVDTGAMGPSPDIPRREAFGLAFSDVTLDEAVAAALALARSRRGAFAVTPNVDHIVQLDRDGEMRAAYRAADLVLCDGMFLKWTLGWLGRPVRAKVSGADLVPALCAAAARQGQTVFLLGAAPQVNAECARRISRDFPGLTLAGALAPPFGFLRDPDAEAAVVQVVREARPDVLLVALGTPAQEKFIHRRREALGAGFAVGVGAAFDFYAGHRRRAPRLVSRLGCEWLWRLAQEPRRLFRRYLIDDPAFLRLAWRERRAGAQAPPTNR